MAITFGNPEDAAAASYNAQQAAIERRRKMIEALMQGPERQQMAGNMVVPYSPMEAFAKVLGTVLASREAQNLDKKSIDLADEYQSTTQKKLADALSKYDTLSRGQPGVQPLTPNDDEGFAMPSSPATPPDTRGANMALVSSGVPALQSAGVSGMLSMGKQETFNLKPGEKRFQGDKVIAENKPVAKVGDVSPAQFTPESVAKFQASGNYQDLVPQAPGDLREFDAALAAAGVQKGTPQYTAAYQQFVAKKTTHPPATSVSVNTEKSYAGNVAEKLAGQDASIIDVARSAPDRVAHAMRVKELLDKNPITGTGATARLAVSKALSTAGIIDGQRVKTTEDLGSELASATLDAIKSSGLGSGQGFTDKDRAFLEKARSGNLEINAGTLRQLADMNEKAGRASIEKANSVIRKLKTNPNMGNVGSALDEIGAPGGGGGGGGLTPSEQAELAALRQRFKR